MCFAAISRSSPCGVVFIHHIDAVADALGVAEFDGLADVEAQAFGRDQAGREFAGMQSDVDLGIDGVEVAEHLHLQRVIAHGDEAILGHDEVDADEPVVVRIDAGLDGFKAEQRLREDLFGRKAAQNLVDVADLHAGRRRAAWAVPQCSRRLRSASTVRTSLRSSETSSRSPWSRSCWRRRAKASRSPRASSAFQPSFVPNCSGMAEGRGLHQLQVLLVLIGGAAGHFVNPLADMAALEATEAFEGGEELVVSAPAGSGNKAAHGNGVDELVIEILIGVVLHLIEASCRHLRSIAGRSHEAERGRIHAQSIFGGIANEGFRIDRAGEMHVKVSAFGELMQKRINGGRSLPHGFFVGVGGAGFGRGFVLRGACKRGRTNGSSSLSVGAYRRKCGEV